MTPIGRTKNGSSGSIDRIQTTSSGPIRKAIAPHGKLILLETILHPDGDSIYPVLSDLNMLLLTGGCERTEAEYRAVLRDAGFELTRTVPTKSPTGTTVIEGRPV